MKKYVLIGLIITLFIATSVSGLSNIDNTQSTDIKNTEIETTPLTHAVLAEQCTATWCSNCPMVAEALYNIYESGDYSFYYVALVDDMNSIAKNRNREYSFGFSKIYAFPTVYFDGGNTNMVGRGSTVQATENEFRTLIEEEGQRTPRQPITMESSITWNGNAKLTVTVSITNQGNFPYLGKIRSFVTEIESRWIDNSGDPYHFAFLDYAHNKVVLLMPGKTKTLTGTFDGNADHGGQTYSDITSDNIMVISAIYHWMPHYRLGYQSDQYTQRYFAHYVDQATAATPI